MKWMDNIRVQITGYAALACLSAAWAATTDGFSIHAFNVVLFLVIIYLFTPDRKKEEA